MVDEWLRYTVDGDWDVVEGWDRLPSKTTWKHGGLLQIKETHASGDRGNGLFNNAANQSMRKSGWRQTRRLLGRKMGLETVSNIPKDVLVVSEGDDAVDFVEPTPIQVQVLNGLLYTTGIRYENQVGVLNAMEVVYGETVAEFCSTVVGGTPESPYPFIYCL